MVMEEFIKELASYAKSVGLKPGTVVQNAGVGGGGTWSKWESGGSCSMRTADKLRKYMAQNPPRKLKAVG